MTTYEGPATVITDEAEYEVAASLMSTVEKVRVPGRSGYLHGLKEWYGTLLAQDSDATWNIHQADQPRLRTDSDREGLFIVERTEVGANTLDIRGSGPAPFGD